MRRSNLVGLFGVAGLVFATSAQPVSAEVFAPYAVIMRLQQDGIINLTVDEAMAGDPFKLAGDGLLSYAERHQIDSDDAISHMIDEAKLRRREATTAEVERGLKAIIKHSGDSSPVGYQTDYAYKGPLDMTILCGSVSVLNKFGGPTGAQPFQVFLTNDGDGVTPPGLEESWACNLGTSIFVFATDEDLLK